jgi:hypothetical protein
MKSCAPGTNGAGTSARLGAWHGTVFARILVGNKTRQGYARERILKPAGYFFVRLVHGAPGLGGSASWQR